MKKQTVLMSLLILLLLEQSYATVKLQQQDSEVIDDKLVAVEDVPFSAIIYFQENNQSFRHVNILMAPEQVTLDNLRLLFQKLSEKYVTAKPLRIYVNTRLEELSSYITGKFYAADPPAKSERDKKEKVEKDTEVRQWAVYIRTENVELIRYNPDYPKENGMKTIILRGKE